MSTGPPDPADPPLGMAPPAAVASPRTWPTTAQRRRLLHAAGRCPDDEWAAALRRLARASVSRGLDRAALIGGGSGWAAAWAGVVATQPGSLGGGLVGAGALAGAGLGLAWAWTRRPRLDGGGDSLLRAVEVALARAGSSASGPARELEPDPAPDERSLDRSLKALRRGDWGRGLRAARTLAAAWPAVEARVLGLATTPTTPTNPGRRWAFVLLEARAASNRDLFERLGDELVCPDCYRRWARWDVPGATDEAPALARDGWHGCRECRRSVEPLVAPAGIVARLDRGMNARHWVEGEAVHVNWISLRRPLDCDAAEIVDATDGEAAELATQLEGDAGAQRRRDLGCLPVEIGPRARVGADGEAALERILGPVVRSERLGAGAAG